MRIFCAVRHSLNPRWYYGELWSGNFYPALRDMEHDVIESQTDLLPTSRFMDIPNDFTQEELEVRFRTTENILEEVRVAHRQKPIDLFLSYFYNAHFDPTGFDDLRHMGIPSVNFYCNSINQFELVAAVAAKVDFSWHAEKDARRVYLSAGANPVWIQMAADPRVYSPIPGTTRVPKACFVGQRYADRDRWMASLIRARVPVEIYGAGWKPNVRAEKPSNQELGESQPIVLGRRRTVPGSWQSYVDVGRKNILNSGFAPGFLRLARQLKYRRETRALTPLFASSAQGPAGEIASVFAQHEVCLNFSNVWSDGATCSSLIPHVRLRDFEAPMCRTCYLTGHTQEIMEFYEVGREIDTYVSPLELVDKVRFYLRHPDAAERLREAGYNRALRDHTWRRRFEDLFRRVNLPAMPSSKAVHLGFFTSKSSHKQFL